MLYSKRNTISHETSKKIPFTDDWMFSMVMRDPEICRELLQRILPGERFTRIQLADSNGGFSDDNAEESHSKGRKSPPSSDHFSALSSQVQAALKFSGEGHGVRFDAYVKSEDVWAEIEMQTYSGEHLGKRSRYYCANMDIDMLLAGTDYKDLKKSYVIFICTHDYMGKGQPVYFFQHYDVENQLPFTDESYILILNTSCDAAKVPENLKALYAYVNDPKNTSQDALIKKIDDRVAQYNGSEWRWMQVTFEEHVKHMAYLAKEEGRSEGRADAFHEIAAKMKAAGMKYEEISDMTGLTSEEIEEL